MKNVLIVGAGPTGLVLALWLIKQGVQVRIIDKNTGPGETSRAMVVHARTLELYRQLNLSDEIVAAGHKNPGINFWVQGKKQAHISFGDAGAKYTPYPFVLVFPQDQHEHILINHLRSFGVEVERHTELLSFEDKDSYIVARLRMPDSMEQNYEAAYIAGCDGARSTVRHQMQADFAGGTYKQIFYVADVQISGLESAQDVNVALEKGDLVMLFSYGEKGLCRLIGTVRGERADHSESLTFEDISHQAINSLGFQVQKVNWFSTYHIHHRVTDHFRNGRAFLLGDAAHVHSPVGGQGMNTGIADAINLAWKLAAVLKGQASENLLDSYEVERLAFARRLVNTTDRLFGLMMTEGRLGDFIKTRIAPFIMSVIYSIPLIREFMFRTVSQTTINYQKSPLSEGKAGKVKGGDRLPWVQFNEKDNYQNFSEIC